MKQRHLYFPTWTLIALFSVFLLFDYYRLMLFSWEIEPPLIDGLYYLGYFLVGSLGIFLFLFYSRPLKNIYSFGLLVLLVLLALFPFWSSTFLKPHFAYLVPGYVLLAFGCAVYAATGFLYVRGHIKQRVVLLIWALMLLATLPAIAEMFSNGIGTSTRVARAAMHITLGDHFLFATLLAMSASRRLLHHFALYVLGIIALLALGSRTALYAFVPVLPLLMLFGSAAITRWTVLPAFLIAIVLAAPVALQALLNSDLRDSRMFGFLASQGSDTSWQGRITALESGWRDIQAHPFVGSFGSDIEQYGVRGMYIHNYLELWRQFGILPFAIFGLLLCAAIHRSLVLLRVDPNFSFGIAVFMVPFLAQIVFSRSYGYPQIFFVLGMTAAMHLTFPLRQKAPRAAGRLAHERPF